MTAHTGDRRGEMVAGGRYGPALSHSLGGERT